MYDLFYKLPSLKKQGIRIHLHCFEYGRGEQPALLEHCEEVYYYKRLQGLSGLSLRKPYIVSSRKSSELLNRLTKDEYPILMEGVHCTYLLNDERFARRICLLRLHNVEHIYYRNLYAFSKKLFKKAYYLWESNLLATYEKKIAAMASVLCVTQKDGEVYKQFGCMKVEYLPLFLPDWRIKSNEGSGTFCLYHGDLSVEENDYAAQWLLQNVFSNLDVPFVIAGKNPSSELEALAENKNHICVVANPNETEMQDMIEKAQINILPSFSNTGIKLKLINALYNGRHCVVNKSTVEGTTLEDGCIMASHSQSFIAAVKDSFYKPFTTSDVSRREALLAQRFNNETNAQRLVELIWNGS